MSTIKIEVNGIEVELQENSTVQSFIEERRLKNACATLKPVA